MMFEPAPYFSRHSALTGSLAHLNRTLFLMVIDSASFAATHSPSKLNLNDTSDFIWPNQ
jgi:hypothetical protein